MPAKPKTPKARKPVKAKLRKKITAKEPFKYQSNRDTHPLDMKASLSEFFFNAMPDGGLY